MEYPAGDIGRVLRELCQSDTKAVGHAVDKYFTDDAQLVGTSRVRSGSSPRFFSGAVVAEEISSYFALPPRAAPLFTTPKRVGKEAVKAAYRVRQVLLNDTGLEVQCAGFDRAKVEKGVERVTGIVDCVQHVKGRLLPLPNALNPTANIRVLIRFDCVKCPDEMYRIDFQEVNIPSDWASTGLHVFPFDAQIANGLKWMGGMAALLVGGTLMRVLG
ncbi:hypothetical protein B0A53_05245 [Rhodotorula sp. CCFEE 5036]|nr:hypothetical protein B0A53_05245 [Rhodotorula sp. CCFEE 5036]